MIKRIFIVIGIAIFIYSCNNNASEKTTDKKENRLTLETKTEYSNQLVNLDTAENMFNLLCQGWVMADDEEALAGMDEDSEFEIPYRSFYFSADGSFIKNPRNAMEYGNWHYDDAKKIISINYGGGGKDIYKIAALASDELKLLNKGINTSTILKFISPGKRLIKAGDEPFYIANNRWRMPPAKKESDAAIRQRLKDQLHFFILFHKSAIVKNDRQVSFWGLPSCFKWYGGAIYMKEKEKLKDNWIECFYNKDQAMKAYAIAEKLMDKKYEWPKGESNWLKQNLAVLEQMYNYIDEIK